MEAMVEAAWLARWKAGQDPETTRNELRLMEELEELVEDANNSSLYAWCGIMHHFGQMVVDQTRALHQRGPVDDPTHGEVLDVMAAYAEQTAGYCYDNAPVRAAYLELAEAARRAAAVVREHPGVD